MAVTKRTRFEILRRDNHTCQYCGAKAPDVTLHIDHVMPVALGGDDKPGNLVTACKDCNSGKSSITPDSPLVQGIGDRAAAYVLGMQDKMTRFKQQFIDLDSFEDEFLRIWNSWHFVGKDDDAHIPLPPDYQMSLLRWQRIGVPIRAFELAISKAMKKEGIRGEFGVFQYMAGTIMRMLDDFEIDLTVTEHTSLAMTSSEAEDWASEWYQKGISKGYDDGFNDGRAYCASRHRDMDFLENHIDGTTSAFIAAHGMREVKSGT